MMNLGTAEYPGSQDRRDRIAETSGDGICQADCATVDHSPEPDL
jgi:hypothetical protein